MDVLREAGLSWLVSSRNSKVYYTHGVVKKDYLSEKMPKIHC
jgi:hypothetical protein